MTGRYDEYHPAAQAAALLAEAEAHIEGQHVVSRVVLKNFEGVVNGANKIGSSVFDSGLPARWVAVGPA